MKGVGIEEQEGYDVITRGSFRSAGAVRSGLFILSLLKNNNWVQKLVEEGGDVDSKDHNEWTAEAHACYVGAISLSNKIASRYRLFDHVTLETPDITEQNGEFSSIMYFISNHLLLNEWQV